MKKLKTIILLLAVIMLLSAITGCGGTEKATIRKDNIKLSKQQVSDIKKKTNKLLTAKSFSGTTSVLLNKKELFKKSYGFSDKSKKTKITDNYVYQLGSLTKAYTGVAVLKLVNEEKIKLTDTLDKYFKGKEYLSEITVQHLLEMRSGLASYTLGISADENARNKLEELIAIDPNDVAIKNYVKDFILKTGTENETGGFNHSHSDYFLLGLIIEKASGVSYEKYITDNILKPLGLKKTSFVNNSKSYRGFFENGEYHTSNAYPFLNNKYVMFSSLGLTSDIEDLNTFYEALFTDELLGEYNEDLSFIHTVLKSSSGYSCGFYALNECIYIQGSTSLHSGEAYINTETKEVAILLSNYADEKALEPLTKEVYNITNAKVNGIILDSLK